MTEMTDGPRFGTADCPPPGFYPNVPQAEYRQWNAPSWSQLKLIGHTLERFKWAVDNPEEYAKQSASEAKLTGEAKHCMVLEPDETEKRFATHPATYTAKVKGKDVEKPWNGNAKFCRGWLAGAESDGLKIVKATEMVKARGMADRLLTLPQLQHDLKGQAELSMVWLDRQTGITCKGRLDLFTGGQIIDLKKTRRKADWQTWTSECKRFGYFGQMAMYRDGASMLLEEIPKVPMFRFYVVEDRPPYTPAIYDVFDMQGAASYELMEYGRQLWHGYLQRLAFAIKKNHWPGHNCENPGQVLEPEELTRPEWIRLDTGDMR